MGILFAIGVAVGMLDDNDGTVGASLILLIVWLLVYGGLVSFGKSIISTGAIGAGIYVFLNRLLIPFGLHHALNSVFWFDVAGINDLGNFWFMLG